jgi:hypothetical protein
MPYIVPERRVHAFAAPETVGELNYSITLLFVQEWTRCPRYATINEVEAACEVAKDNIRNGIWHRGKGLEYGIMELCRVFYFSDCGSSDDCVGAVGCAQKEFYRRVAVPYEDHMCEVNGDVYP